MFSRRRATSNPPINSTPTPSAALAATQAFLKNRESNASLSSTAAAAALRTHPLGPTQVADVQTRRMIRRGSGSSIGSATGGDRSGSSPVLRRQTSSGSMTERSFRTASPSPNRVSTSRGVEYYVPPVPAIPKDLAGFTDTNRPRASSMDYTARIASPPPKRQGGRGVSVDTGARQPQKPPRARRSTPVNAPDQSASPRSSINFSRPYSPQSTPPASPESKGWYTGPLMTNQKPRGDATRIQTAKPSQTTVISNINRAVQDAAERPVSKKTKKLATGGEGSRLTSGGMDVKPTGTAVNGLQASKHAETTPTTGDSPTSPTTKARRILSASQDTEYETPRTESKHARTQQMAPNVTTPGKSTHTGLQKKPSVVYEDSQREEREERETTATTTHERELGQRSVQRVATVPPSGKSIGPDQPYVRSSSKTTLAPSTLSAVPPGVNGTLKKEHDRSRQSSASPSRSAHFSSVPVDASTGVKHQPLPRAVSPAKSALKHSPLSVRTASPSTAGSIKAGGAPPSEASDTVSEDGIKSSARKKKSVRVSFDAEPMIAGWAAGPVTPVSPASPGHSAETAVEDPDDVLKPTPALPSFGSVRGRRRAEESEPAEKVTETVSSSLSNSMSMPAAPQEASSDVALGNIVAQDFATKKESEAKDSPQNPKSGEAPSNEPLPPEVTSVEGSGYFSDSNSSTSDKDDTHDTVAPIEHGQAVGVIFHESTEPPDGDAWRPDMDSGILIPNIAIQPATPAAMEREQEPLYIMPGGFPDATPDITPSPSPVPVVRELFKATVNVEPVPVAPARSPEDSRSLIEPPVEREAETVSSTDNESIYSDAAEDMTDSEAGDFASLDALMKKPVTVPIGERVVDPVIPGPVGSVGTIPEATEAEPIPEAIGAGGPETIAKPYGTTRKERKQPTRDAEVGVGPVTTQLTTATPPKPKKKKKRASVPEREPQQQPAYVSSYSPQSRQNPKPAGRSPRTKDATPDIRQSKPADMQTPSDVSIRKTMRPRTPGASSAADGLESSKHNRPTTPKGALQKKSMRASMPTMDTTPSQAFTTPQAAPSKQSRMATASKAVPPLGRTTSYGSDSDQSASSFTRTRRTSDKSSGGRMTMRHSMRESMDGGIASSRPMSASGPPKPSRFSGRPTSPSDSVMSDSRAKPMRMSMRASMDAPPPSFRGTEPSKRKSKSPSRFTGFGRDKAKPVREQKGGSGSRFQSRFADSSDEEEDGRRRTLPAFRTRFADSDSDDDTKLTPVRGIPRKPGAADGDSTDLDDSSDNGGRTNRIVKGKGKAKAKAKGAPSQSAGGDAKGRSVSENVTGVSSSKYADTTTPGAITSLGVTESEKKRRSFFGFGKKKEASPLQKVDMGRPQTPPALDQFHEMSAPGSPSSPRPPRLQRRNTPQFRRATNDSSWPLQDVQEASETDDERPRTSDGLARAKKGRPGMGSRLGSAPPVPALPALNGVSVVGPAGMADARGRTGKKKRFPGLRKVFGLVD